MASKKAPITLMSLLLTILVGVEANRACPSKKWSADELALAGKLGLDLKPRGESLRYRSVGEQTWLCPWVVDGVVQRIEEDLYGPYHTRVIFSVKRYLKGNGPAEISLLLTSGRLYSQHYKDIVVAHTVGSVEFPIDDVNSRFIVFLNKYVPSQSGHESELRKYELGETEFRPANRYRVSNGRAVPDPEMVAEAPHPGAVSYSYEALVEEILRVAVPQSKLAEKKP